MMKNILFTLVVGALPAAAVAAGEQHGELVWQFDKAGTVDYVCLIPGHMEAGMVAKVKVPQL